MARRRRNKPGILAKAPWQVNLPLTAVFAGVSYYHTEFAQFASAAAASLAAMPALAKVLAMPLDILGLVGGGLAAMCTGVFTLTGMARSWKRKRQRAQAVQAVSDTQTLESLDWRQFEFLVAQHFKDKGYRVKEGAGVRDGGVDVTLVRGNETLLVQCKHWKSSAVGVVVVRELAGVVQLNRATGGVLVCSGRYTREAEVEAMQLGIHLLTGDDLLKHIQVLAA